MFYDRKVKYLDYCEKGERIKGCGVAKLEMRDEYLNMAILVSGLENDEYFQRPIVINTENGAFELGMIHIENGKGSFRLQHKKIEEVSATAYQDWIGLRIEVDAEKEIRCEWGQDTVKAASREGRQIARSEAADQDNREQIEKRVMNAEEKSSQQMQQPQQLQLSQEQPQQSQGQSQQLQEQPQQPQGQSRPPRLISLADNKWSQLWKIYPHVKPFEDEREYLSIRPADFVLFSSDSYRAVNNSFLLHGFYNYHHLLLGQIEKNGEKIYYVGVPGNYFEREKQVAIMFGFESFECREEPAQAGDFGYYMIRAQL